MYLDVLAFLVDDFLVFDFIVISRLERSYYILAFGSRLTDS